jgi:DNA-directed RNA polymerase subunit RPC12/RpoP
MKKIQDFETYKKRLRTLKGFREEDMSQLEFDVIVVKKYDEKYSDKIEENKNIVISSEEFENEVGLWISREEADEALEQYNKYVKSRNIVEVSDLTLLKNLVFYEMQLKRVARAINEEYRKVKAEGKTADVPSYELKTINSINEQIIELKKVLGLAEEQKGADPFIYIEQLKKKFKVWRENNQGSRTLVCPHCSQMVMLKIRTESWEALKHPFFKDKILCNDWAWELYKTKVITSLDLAKILLGKDCKSDLFVQWLEKKIYGIKENIDPLKESGID